MARARNIKPSMYKNELLGVADPLLTILFTGLWCLADRDGRLEDRPLRIKAEIFPYRDLPLFNGYLTELEQMGFIERYSVDGVAIIQVVNFAKHQSPHKTEKHSELPEKPAKPISCPITVVAPLKTETPPVKESLIPDSLNLIPDSLIPDPLILNPETPLTPPKVAAQVQEIFEYWRLVMGKNKSSLLTKERDKAVKEMLKTGYSMDAIKSAIDGCKRSNWHQGVNDRRTVYDDLELICRTGKNLEGFINNTGTGSGVETIEMTQDRIQQQAERVAAALEEYES